MWDAFKDAIFYCIQFFYSFIGDWGMAIVVITLIFRLILFPLMQKQVKATFAMQKLQPKMAELQERYADNQPRLQEEMQKLYAESHFNPLASCLPMLLQMPIFIALFQVLQEMSSRTSGSSYQFYHILPDLVTSPATSFEQGINVFIPYLILLIIFAGATFLPMILQMKGNAGPQKNQTLMMSAVMTVMMLWIGWSSPAGVLLFWGTSSVFGVLQQQITMKILKDRDAAEEEAKADITPVEVDVTRKVKKKRPTKKN